MRAVVSIGTWVVIVVALGCLPVDGQTDRKPRGTQYEFLPLPMAQSPATNSTPSAPLPETKPAPPVPNPAGADGSGGTVGEYDDGHLLQPGERLTFRILEDRTPNDPPKILTISASGEVDVPYIGLVRATGKTCRQLAQEIKALLEKDYYYQATVVMGLDPTSKVRGRVYIWGQVRNQGAIEFPPNEVFTASKAILRAGGFGEFAKKNAVKLIRTLPGGEKRTFELNMVDILEKGKVENDVVLEPDDLILVPQKWINF